MITKPTLAEALKVPNVLAIEATSPLNVYVTGDALPTHMTVVSLTAPQILALFDTSEPLLADVRDQAQGAFDANTTYLAIGTPTTAQVAAQVRALTQQMQRVIRAVARIVVKSQP